MPEANKTLTLEELDELEGMWSQSISLWPVFEMARRCLELERIDDQGSSEGY